EIAEVSTLTGAVVIGLGDQMGGVMSKDKDLLERLLTSAHKAGEDMWPLPFHWRLEAHNKSSVAGTRNIGSLEGHAGAITAYLFIAASAKNTPYVHCDIAGPTSASKPWGVHPEGATGFGVMTAVQFVLDIPRV
ncbi:MAG: aminopeptidase, partial [bacterium]|nr:aminopeptidase [bacterium]